MSQLFAGNIALPMIAYVYWQKEVSSFRLTCINIATLSGTLLGQVLFGFLADLNGRKKMYGIELVLLIGSTLGVVMCSQGYNGNMSIYAWLIWWRFMVGVGVGADYPLSATITAESVLFLLPPCYFFAPCSPSPCPSGCCCLHEKASRRRGPFTC